MAAGVDARDGRVAVKVGSWLGREMSVHPEYEDCQALARKKRVPLKEIMEAAEQKVHLFLFVKVRENWGDDPERYREMGLEFPRK